MIHAYYLIIIVLTALSSSLVTMYLPALKNVYKRIKNSFKRKPNTLEQRIKNLESRLAKREENIKLRIRKEVKQYLEELSK